MAQTNRRLEKELKQIKVEHKRVQTEQDEMIAKQEMDLDELNKKLADHYCKSEEVARTCFKRL